MRDFLTQIGNGLDGNFKEKRECCLLNEFCNALSQENSQAITFECGEKDSSDGRLIIDKEIIPVQIVTAEGIIERKSALSRKTKELIVYDGKPIEWIKHALEIKVRKNYYDEKELTILIEYNGLGSINREYLTKKLKEEEIIDLANRFKDVYVISLSDCDYIQRDPPQKEPILFKVPLCSH